MMVNMIAKVEWRQRMIADEKKLLWT